MPKDSRPRADETVWRQAARQLTDRDRVICRLLYDHRVLTTAQVCDACFSGERRARLRLDQLWALRVVDRFRPMAPTGSAPYHWVLDELGAAALAAEDGVPVDQLGWRRDKALALTTSQRLGHLVGANGVFTSLMAAARRRPDADLVVWWSERRCTAAWGDYVRPDGYGVWVEGDRRQPFCLEYDNGTEHLDRLSAKLGGYADLLAAAGRSIWLLFVFGGPRREAGARRALVHPGVPVATAVLDTGQGPADAAWLPVTATGPRRRLADLGRPRATTVADAGW